jgi:tetratricopeptide (TPR) repeat protein
VIHVRGGAAWFDADRWASFNIRREAVAREVKATLLFWLNEEAIAALARVAIDLWAWRAAVVTFASAPSLPGPPAVDFRAFDDRPAGERERRVAFLRDAVLAPDLPGDLRAELHAEMGDLLAALGRPAPALRAYEEARRETQDERSRAVIMGRIADGLEARGELEEALRIRREEELPVYERLGDVRSRAVTLFKIASTEFGVARNHGDDGNQRMAATSEAFETFRGLGMPDGVGHSGLLFARLLAESGRSGEAERVLEVARAGFAKLSDSDGMQQVDELRRSLTPTQ